ncbi:putative alpha-1,6-mannanase (GH76 family) [Neolewinella xylanilytica]|uniref:Putative alpha-1,6-mannanase (GH76 family) n=1 Tax=Neolewinella xylanilytica TaxID=1514080 RepID=A0A2S6I6K0_9BACT|nr:glycoside hydrolase family 76 protein [Neolewinella xylanilytica]PPK87125.1 putative alpha-1,6-mannanase (GH76 family) [Neolewinella xylanilytica]
MLFFRLPLPYVLAGLFLVTFLACEKDEPIPLRDPTGGGEAVTYDWGATADSVQAATYTTYLGSEGTFVENNQGSSTFQYWPNAHVLHTLVDGYVRTGDPAYRNRMIDLLRGIETRNGGTYSNVFNDDMLWLGNASMRAYEATDNPEYLEVAKFLWNDVLESHSDVFGGGISWKKDTPYSKNAVSNGPAIVLAMRLYEAEQDSSYLNWATELYAWQKANLVDPSTGLVWDNISETNGEVTVNKDWIFTYNLGTWIGAGLRLYDATGDRTYLDDALRSGRTLLTSPQLTTEGVLRDEGQGDGGLFKGILVRYFTELIMHPDVSDADRADFLEFLTFNARTLYNRGLQRPEMLAGPNWAAQPGDRTDLTTQISAVMLIEAMAKLEAEGFL